MARRHYRQKSKKESVTDVTSRCDGTSKHRSVSWPSVTGDSEPDISAEQKRRASIGVTSRLHSLTGF
jgi:hypothetical protein